MRTFLLVNVIVAGVGLAGAKSLTKSGLQVEVTKEVRCKENKKAENGDKVTVHYGGFLQDGKQSFNSIDKTESQIQKPHQLVKWIGFIICSGLVPTDFK